MNPGTGEFAIAIPAALYQIDANTGQTSRIASTQLGLATVANVNGTIYGFSGATNQIVTLDVTNGATRFVSDIDASVGLIGGAAAIPEPDSIGLIALAFAAFGLCKLRKAGRQ